MRPPWRAPVHHRHLHAYFHAQHRLLNGHSLHCHPTIGWKAPTSIAYTTSATSRNSRTFAARSRVVQY
ncbi:MAG: hypothetical protein ACRD3I_12930, partial [Terriglobales bacterium]